MNSEFCSNYTEITKYCMDSISLII